MLRFFKNKNPLMYVIYVFISILIVLDIPDELINKINSLEHEILLKQFLILIEGKYFVIFYKITLAILLIANAYVYNNLLTSIRLFKVNNYFLGFTFIVLIGFAVIKYDCIAVLFSSLLFLFAFKIIFNTLRKGIAVFDYLNVGILFSIAFLFWELTLYYTLIIFVSILIFRIQNWREWVAVFIGLFLPLFITISIYFFINSNFDIIFDTYQLFFNRTLMYNIDIYQLIVLSFVLILSLFSIFKILARFNSIESNNQDYYKTFSSLFLITIIVSLTVPSNIYNNYIIGVISLNIVFNSSFLFIKNRIISEIIFDIFLIMSIFIYVL